MTWTTLPSSISTGEFFLKNLLKKKKAAAVTAQWMATNRQPLSYQHNLHTSATMRYFQVTASHTRYRIESIFTLEWSKQGQGAGWGGCIKKLGPAISLMDVWEMIQEKASRDRQAAIQSVDCPPWEHFATQGGLFLYSVSTLQGPLHLCFVRGTSRLATPACMWGDLMTWLWDTDNYWLDLRKSNLRSLLHKCHLFQMSTFMIP